MAMVSSDRKSLMRTDEPAYSEYLERKYLPGRRLYLQYIFYPKILRHFHGNDTILDLGCGTGEFLNYCRSQKRDVLGVDSNKALFAKNQNAGFEVILDDVCKLTSLKNRHFRYAVCDNVLEHLEMAQIRDFFQRIGELLSSGGVLVCVVPGAKGFQMDPTHRTYVTPDVLKEALESSIWRIRNNYFHPLNLGEIDKFLYLNMQVFEITRV